MEAYLRAAKAIRKWSNYAKKRARQGRTISRAVIRLNLKSSCTAISKWIHYAQSRIVLRRCLKVFRLLHLRPACGALWTKTLRNIFQAWSCQYTPMMARERCLRIKVQALNCRNKLRTCIESWESAWGKKLETRVSLYRCISKFVSATVRGSLEWSRMKEKMLQSGKIKFHVPENLRSVLQCNCDRGVCVCALRRGNGNMHLLRLILDRTRHLSKKNFGRLAKLRRIYSFWITVITNQKIAANDIFVSKQSAINHTLKLIPIGECLLESTLQSLKRKIFQSWITVMAHRRRISHKCLMKLVVKPALLHWRLLVDEIALRRFRLLDVGDASFFSKELGPTADNLIAKNRSNNDLRSLKSKYGHLHIDRKYITGNSDIEVSIKQRSGVQQAHVTTGRRPGEATAALNKAIVCTKEYSTSKIPLSSSSIKSLWGSKTIDDCHGSTYLGQYRKRGKHHSRI